MKIAQKKTKEGGCGESSIVVHVMTEGVVFFFSDKTFLELEKAN